MCTTSYNKRRASYVSRPMPLLQSLSYHGLLPETFNNPFDYVPHPVCEAAVRDLLPHVEELMCGNPEGKMFGVLVVTKEEDLQNLDNQRNGDVPLYYLAAFSGQLYDKSVLPGFVPPVFDFLAPDGYFKRHEAEISDINRKIAALQSNSRYVESRNAYRQLQDNAENAIAEAKTKMLTAKEKRDAERSKRVLTPEEEAAFLKESQFLKAEVRRVKKRWEEALNTARQELETKEKPIAELSAERKRKSEALQNTQSVGDFPRHGAAASTRRNGRMLRTETVAIRIHTRIEAHSDSDVLVGKVARRGDPSPSALLSCLFGEVQAGVAVHVAG